MLKLLEVLRDPLQKVTRVKFGDLSFFNENIVVVIRLENMHLQNFDNALAILYPSSYSERYQVCFVFDWSWHRSGWMLFAIIFTCTIYFLIEQLPSYVVQQRYEYEWMKLKLYNLLHTPQLRVTLIISLRALISW